jgi:hypothetical protein
MDVDRLGRGAVDPVREQGQERDVIEMGVCDEDMTDCVQRLVIEIAYTTAGVDQDIVIDQDGCGSPARTNAAAGPQDADGQAHAGGLDRRLQARTLWRRGEGGGPMSMGGLSMAQS